MTSKDNAKNNAKNNRYKPICIRVQPGKKVIWANIAVQQPERWSVRLGNFKHRISAEYFVGNSFVKVEQSDTTPIGTLMQLHTASVPNILCRIEGKSATTYALMKLITTQKALKRFQHI